MTSALYFCSGEILSPFQRRAQQNTNNISLHAQTKKHRLTLIIAQEQQQALLNMIATTSYP